MNSHISFTPLGEEYYKIKYTAPHFLYDKNRAPAGYEKINEKFIQYLWAEQVHLSGAGTFKNPVYQTLDNKKVKVVFPGFWNLEKGPDFKQVRLKIGNKTLSGDIEVHLYSSDWHRHGHQKDPDYNKVVLHVTCWRDDKTKFVRNQAHKEIPQIVLSPFLEEQLEEIDRLLDLDSFYPVGARFGGTGQCYQTCCRPERTKKIRYFLEMAGETRLLTKVQRFKNRLAWLEETQPESAEHLYDELFYQGIMEALGYKSNQTGFLELARRIPYTRLKKMVSILRPPEQPLAIQSILLKNADLVPKKYDTSFDKETVRYLESLEEVWQRLKDRVAGGAKTGGGNKAIGWSFTGVRPTNFPPRRIAGLSYLLARANTEGGLFQRLLEAIETTPEKIRSNIDFCFNPEIKSRDYWQTHSSFQGKAFKKGMILIGKERLEAITINIIIPIFLLYARERDDVPFTQTLLLLYRNYPQLGDNYITRFMKYRLFGNEKKIVSNLVQTACQEQGLLQIFYDFCKKGYEGCANCGFLNWLRQSGHLISARGGSA